MGRQVADVRGHRCANTRPDDHRSVHRHTRVRFCGPPASGRTTHLAHDLGIRRSRGVQRALPVEAPSRDQRIDTVTRRLGCGARHVRDARARRVRVDSRRDGLRTMRRVGFLLAAVGVLLALSTAPASSITHQASAGNYWYEDDQQHDRTKIVVRQGDQITFTIREQAVPGHTVDVDELNIHSPNLNIGETYTTPRLIKPGNYYLYCRPHEQRGHHTRLVVLAAQQATATPPPNSTPRKTSAPSHAA